MTLGFFSCSDAEREQGAGRRCIISIVSYQTAGSLAHTFVPVILFHLLHRIQSPVLVPWFLTLGSLPAFWPEIHFSQLCPGSGEGLWHKKIPPGSHPNLLCIFSALCSCSPPCQWLSGSFPEGKASLQARFGLKFPYFDFNLKSKLHQVCAVITGFVMGF